MPEEKNESSPHAVCGLPKGGNACQYAKLAPDFCERCGWNPEEQARRKALPFKKSEDGPAAQGYQHQGIGNQPGNLLFWTYAAAALP